jgi:hypothetical protein
LTLCSGFACDDHRHGTKESGIGLELGREGILSHTKLRSGVKAHRQMI